MSVHDPKDPRHARVFEILRQNEMAADVTHHVQQSHAILPELDRLDAFRRTALKSLERSDVATVGAEPSRHHKLF